MSLLALHYICGCFSIYLMVYVMQTFGDFVRHRGGRGGRGPMRGGRSRGGYYGRGYGYTGRGRGWGMSGRASYD